MHISLFAPGLNAWFCIILIFFSFDPALLSTQSHAAQCMLTRSQLLLTLSLAAGVSTCMLTQACLPLRKCCVLEFLSVNSMRGLMCKFRNSYFGLGISTHQLAAV